MFKRNYSKDGIAADISNVWGSVMRKAPKFLIEMKHGLGDCVCMLPALKALRSKFPDAYIALIVSGKPSEDVVNRSCIKINKFYYLSLKNRSKVSTLSTLWKLRKEKFDYGILSIMTPKQKGKMLFKLIGVKKCLGEQYLGLNGLDLDNKKHFVERNLDILKPICGIVEITRPQLFIDSCEKENMRKQFSNAKPLIVVNIGGAEKNYYKGHYYYTRNWNFDYMKKLVLLLSKYGFEICLLGGKLEEHLLDKYTGILNQEGIHNYVNKLPISDSMTLISICNLSIGVDTGTQHIADALGIPTLSIFGPTNPHTHGAYSPRAVFLEGKTTCQYCFGTDLYYFCTDRKCINQITPSQVVERAMKILN